MSTSIACITAFCTVLIGCQAGGCSYFAAFVNTELRPYFAAHGMESDSNDAREAFIYLVLSAVVLWLSFLRTIYSICNSSERNSSDDSGCGKLLKAFFNIAVGLAVLTLACLTAKYAFGWWHYFDTQGLDHLAANCQGLAGMIVAAMALSLSTVVVYTIMILSSDC
ncbi:hypothetical protein F5Y13DRAFT_156019 [Hypoxylon sp. FL1857]|nr:hypothetical protein F5Y13DRAFT_156019 [Hypoxylon sp. FL1857]